MEDLPKTVCDGEGARTTGQDFHQVSILKGSGIASNHLQQGKHNLTMCLHFSD